MDRAVLLGIVKPVTLIELVLGTSTLLRLSDSPSIEPSMSPLWLSTLGNHASFEISEDTSAQPRPVHRENICWMQVVS